MAFIDIVSIDVESGSGGHGGVFFRKEKYIPNGGPNGGDGGDGGSVILEANNNLHTLLDFRFKHKFSAEPGENGKGKNQFGKKGKNLLVKVPVGTVVRDKETGKVIADLMENEQTFVVARGGKGGRGNVRFASSMNKAPHYSEPGQSSIKKALVLELKSIADVGLVGLPNAGKSSLLSVVSKAKPKIADYPFTTLAPNLGVVGTEYDKGFVIADIPGLIEGAHQGVGLGHQFLKHIERTRMILHVVDLYDIDPVNDYEIINGELSLYAETLLEKPKIIVLNKKDLMDDETLGLIREEFEKYDHEIFCISAVTNQGVKELMNHVAKRLEDIPKLPPIEIEQHDDAEELEDRFAAKYTITRENETFIINSDRIVRILQVTDTENQRALNRFMKILNGIGLIKKLEEMGAQEGHTVKIGELEFDYYPDH